MASRGDFRHRTHRERPVSKNAATDVTYRYIIEMDRSQVPSVEATREQNDSEFDMSGSLGREVLGTSQTALPCPVGA